MDTREHPMPGQVLMTVSNLDDYDGGRFEQRQTVTDAAAADVVTSLIVEDPWPQIAPPMHKPVLDIDFPVTAIPSSTPGHFHLYLDKALTWEQYDRLLVVMAEIGLLEPGYVGASRERKHTAVRLPWVRKGDRAPETVAVGGV